MAEKVVAGVTYLLEVIANSYGANGIFVSKHGLLSEVSSLRVKEA